MCSDTNGQLRLILTRCFLGQGYFCLFLLSATLLPLSLHMIIFQTAPFWTTILSMLFNREKVFCYEYVAMFLCFCGVVCMSQPSG